MEKSIWAKLPVVMLHKEFQWGSGPWGGVLVGPDGATSDSPKKADSQDPLCILPDLLLLIVPGDVGCGMEGQGEVTTCCGTAESACHKLLRFLYFVFNGRS